MGGISWVEWGPAACALSLLGPRLRGPAVGHLLTPSWGLHTQEGPLRAQPQMLQPVSSVSRPLLPAHSLPTFYLTQAGSWLSLPAVPALCLWPHFRRMEKPQYEGTVSGPSASHRTPGLRTPCWASQSVPRGYTEWAPLLFAPRACAGSQRAGMPLPHTAQPFTRAQSSQCDRTSPPSLRDTRGTCLD